MGLGRARVPRPDDRAPHPRPGRRAWPAASRVRRADGSRSASGSRLSTSGRSARRPRSARSSGCSSTSRSRLAVALVLRRGDGPAVLAGVSRRGHARRRVRARDAAAPGSIRRLRRPVQPVPARRAARVLERLRPPYRDGGDPRRRCGRARAAILACSRRGSDRSRPRDRAVLRVLARLLAALSFWGSRLLSRSIRDACAALDVARSCSSVGQRQSPSHRVRTRSRLRMRRRCRSSRRAPARVAHRRARRVLGGAGLGRPSVREARSNRARPSARFRGRLGRGAVACHPSSRSAAAGGPAERSRGASHRFEAEPAVRADLNERLFSVSGNGRGETIRVAWDSATEHPVVGTRRRHVRVWCGTNAGRAASRFATRIPCTPRPSPSWASSASRFSPLPCSSSRRGGPGPTRGSLRPLSAPTSPGSRQRRSTGTGRWSASP